MSGATNVEQVIAFEGDLTFDTARKQLRCLHKKIDEAASHFGLDLCGIGKIDSAGLALMIEGKKHAYKLGKKMYYRNLPELYKKLLKFYELDKILLNNPQKG